MLGGLALLITMVVWWVSASGGDESSVPAGDEVDKADDPAEPLYPVVSTSLPVVETSEVEVEKSAPVPNEARFSSCAEGDWTLEGDFLGDGSVTQVVGTFDGNLTGCFGESEVFNWYTGLPQLVSAFAVDIDADGITELLLGGTTAYSVIVWPYRIAFGEHYEVLPLLAQEDGFSYGIAPDGDNGWWWGCTDLDGDGIERLATGSWTYDSIELETAWTLAEIVAAGDASLMFGIPVSGLFPTDRENDPAELIPGRALCDAGG